MKLHSKNISNTPHIPTIPEPLNPAAITKGFTINKCAKNTGTINHATIL